MGNLTSSQGVQSQGNAMLGTGFWPTADGVPSLPTIQSSFAPSQTSAGNVTVSQGGASSLAGVVANGAPAWAIGTPSNAVAGSQPAPSSGVATGSIADYFLRTVIIMLGFIFVAIGLNMFRPGTVPVPRIGAG